MKDELKNLFNKYNIKASETQIEKLCCFYDLVVSYNEKINLTAIIEKNDFAIKHLLDSVICNDLLLNKQNIIDIGAGAGFPSIPLAILNPDKNFTLIDSVNKKTIFQNLAIKELSLKNISAVNTRIEEFVKNRRCLFDCVLARAVAQMPTLLEYALPFLKVGGVCLAYKSVDINNELEGSQNALKTLGGKIVGVKPYNIENLTRNIVVVEKVGETPKAFPRAQNKPRIKPL